MSVFAVLGRLSSVIESEVNLVINSKQEAASLSKKLNKIQEGLKEAEKEGFTKTTVKNWLKQLEDVTYEIEDVLDELETANLQVQVEDTSLNWDRVRSLLDFLCSCFNQVRSRREITLEMKALSVKIDDILTEKGKYTFVPGVNDRAHENKQKETTSVINKKDKFYGLDRVKKNLVDKLVLEGEGSGDDTQIIAIVGVGGVGKSTLARVAFNDTKVDGFFFPKGWVSVSQTFDPLAVAKAILESFGEKSNDAFNLEMVVQLIKKAVNNKRFLLILDNVWTEDRNKWEDINNCLDGCKGSRIVVTTRHEKVARMMGTAQWQPLELLSHKDCGAILNGVALEGRSREERENLIDIGKEIAKKCNGLPLAANSVGRMLSLGSFTQQEWRDVFESPLWTNGEEESEIFSILNLSYTDLSPVLKRCFLTSVFFPKGTEIRSDEIRRVWIAYGYLNSNGSVAVQSKGSKFLNDLVMRSFFQKFAIDVDSKTFAVLTYEKMSYKMHDIMHDFATHLLSKSDEYIYIRDGELEKVNSTSPSLNNLSLGRFRTFIVRGIELSPSIVSHLTRVRVLSMRGCNLEGLPEDIGKLIHLRLLNVSHNPIRELPKTITDLCNLQTLDIESCDNLSCLPEGIEKLINLRHLLNRMTSYEFKFPQGMEKLSGLLTLSEFRGPLGILRNLNQLQGSLVLLLMYHDLERIGDPMLCEKQHIEELNMVLGIAEETDGFVEALKPPPNLLALDLVSSGKWFCHWIHSLDNLKLVVFCHSINGSKYNHVPPFYKLPALEELGLLDCDINHLSKEFLGLDQDASSSKTQVVGGFPRLKKLVFSYCARWRGWEDINEEEAEEESIPIMPFLEELVIRECRYLQVLPHRLLGKAKSLRAVKILNCEMLYKRYNEKSGYEREKMPMLSKQMWTVVR